MNRQNSNSECHVYVSDQVIMCKREEEKCTAKLTVLCGVEVWVRIRYERRIQAKEIKNFRALKGCAREGGIETERIRSEFQIYLITERIDEARVDWR